MHCLLVLLAFGAEPPAPEPPQPPPPGVVLTVGDGAGPARLILPPSVYDQVVGREVAPARGTGAAGPVVAGVALAVAAILVGWRLAGKKLRTPRLALGAAVALLLTIGFSGCGLGTGGDDIAVAQRDAIALRCAGDHVTGEVRLERGTDEGAATLVVPAAELRKLPRP